MSKYTPYPKYKESGVEYLGKVPFDWHVNKLKYNALIYNGNSISDNQKQYYENQNMLSSVPYISTKDINPEYFTVNYANGLRIPNKLIHNFKLAKAYSTVVCIEGGSAGKKLAYLDQNVCFVNKLACIKSNKSAKPKFIYYFTHSALFKYSFRMATTGLIPGVSITELKDFIFLIPTLSEQTAIANFLDRETAKIDILIDRQQRLIELLQEKRQAVISHAVTKGLDPNVKMKDSGVEWLGEVPAHWEVKKFKYLFRIKKRIAGKLGYDVLSITQKGIKVKDVESGEGQLSSDYSKYQIVRVGDFAMNHMDLLTGFVDLSKFDGVTSPDYRVFSLVQQNASSEYYLYLLQMGYLNKLFYPFGQGSSHLGRWRLPTEAFNEFIAPFPPFDEQVRIAEYIKESLKKFEDLTQKANQAITLLKERRTALISAAVTGKIDVRNIAV